MIISNLKNATLLVLQTIKKYEIEDVFAEINPHDTASMLGYKNVLPDDILNFVKETMCETAGFFDIRGGYHIFDDVNFIDNERICITNIDFFPRNIVYNQLKHSEQIAVFVCTAGEGISQYSKQMLASNEPLKGFISDILGSLAVETATDMMQKELKDKMAKTGSKITNRYSPGYCGWHTQEQHKLFSLLPKGYCGVHLTESALMQPVKSVSGFIGVGKNVRYNAYSCKMHDAIGAYHCAKCSYNVGYQKRP